VNLKACIQVFPGGCLVQVSREDGDTEEIYTCIMPTIEEAVEYAEEFLKDKQDPGTDELFVL
jgi:hypothetical protein